MVLYVFRSVVFGEERSPLHTAITVATIQKELEATVVDIHIKSPVSLMAQNFILHIFESLL